MDCAEASVFVLRLSLLRRCMLVVADPLIMQELFTTKNNDIDKNIQTELMMKELIGESFLFSKATDAWKAKRKACAHAFYKDKLVVMLGTLQESKSVQGNCKEQRRRTYTHPLLQSSLETWRLRIENH